MRVLVLLMVLPFLGCAMHSQISGGSNPKANLWLSVDLDGEAKGPSFDDGRFVDVDGTVSLWPPAVGAGVQLNVTAKPKKK